MTRLSGFKTKKEFIVIIPSKCDRCRQSLNNCTISKFNSDILCNTCDTKEKSHPDYSMAERIVNEMKKKSSNFMGIGKPSDL